MLKPFFIRQERMLLKIQPEDVVGLSTEGNYTKIFLSDKTYYNVRATLSNVQKKLPPDRFIKIHRAIIMSIHHIHSIYKDYLVVGNETIPIGKQYYQSLLDKLNIIE